MRAADLSVALGVSSGAFGRRRPERVDGPWTLDTRDIARLEDALYAFPAFHARPRVPVTDRRFDRPLDAYPRQPADFCSNGRRVVHVNLWIGVSGSRWQREAAACVVRAGGPSTWGVECDVATGRFANPAFNVR